MPLSSDDIKALHAIARDAVRAATAGREPAPPSALPDALTRPGAAFVTLRRDGELRGCIGHLKADQPLWRSVQEMAAAAASRDSRFDSINPAEVDRLTIEISVLSPMVPCRADEVAPGRDGLYVVRGGWTGLLLPQVAVEYGWDRETFLAHACRKAGLAPDAWREPETRIFRFTAEIV